jgi:hypothetical protein
MSQTAQSKIRSSYKLDEGEMAQACNQTTADMESQFRKNIQRNPAFFDN